MNVSTAPGMRNKTGAWWEFATKILSPNPEARAGISIVNERRPGMKNREYKVVQAV